MLETLKLRFIYALHMALPLGVALWHIDRLSAETVTRLREMFPG